MKNLTKSQIKKLRNCKFMIAVICVFTLASCGDSANADNPTNENETEVKGISEKSLVDKIFVSIKTDWYGSSLFYFYSQDSVFYRIAGNNLGNKYGYSLSNKGVLSITENGKTRKTIFEDLNESYEHNYQLIGDKVLSGEINTFYSVNSFSEAFQINK
jgi:hypothetical protein